ncbi:MAG: MBL fold metallo-hydrolase [Bacteroidales bacterium]|nr:MBL fold metallo-hydrolase [Bacteroidales bacterium]
MNIHRLIFSPIEVNTYVIDDGTGRCAIIDCGCYNESEFSRLKAFLKEKQLSPVLLLNTHMHLDHIFGNGCIFKEYGLLTHAAEQEESNRASALKHAALFGLTMDEPPVIGTIIEGGQEVKFGKTVLKAIFVPGHSAGSIAYYCEADKVVFTGDALFADSIGRTDLPGGDYDTLINSIKAELLTLDESTVVYPGHGDKTTIGQEKINNQYLNS